MLFLRAEWPYREVDLASCTLSFTVQAVFAGWAWSDTDPRWRPILVGTATIFPFFQAVCHFLDAPHSISLITIKYLRIRHQQHQLSSISSKLKTLCSLFMDISSLAKISIVILGPFVSASLYAVGLFLPFLDYLVVPAWYAWLITQSAHIASQSTLRYSAYCLAIMDLVLLVIAIVGTVLKAWLKALEVSSTTAPGLFTDRDSFNCFLSSHGQSHWNGFFEMLLKLNG